MRLYPLPGRTYREPGAAFRNTIPARIWPRPYLEALEDRLAPAVLQVVGSGGNGTTTFDTFAQAYQASSAPSDIIQIEPSAGDVGPIALINQNSALTVQGDPNFATGPATEAADNVTIGVNKANLLHLYLNQGTTVSAGFQGAFIHDVRLTTFTESADLGPRNNTLSHDVIAGNVVLPAFSFDTTVMANDQLLNCDFKPGAQLQIGTLNNSLFPGISNVLVSGCIFEPSPTTAIAISSADQITVRDTTISIAGPSVAVQASSPLTSIVFERDDIHSLGGSGIQINIVLVNLGFSVPVQVSVEGTAFQVNDVGIGMFQGTHVSTSSTSYLDAGGGGHSSGGNEFLVHQSAAISPDGATVRIFANHDAVGPGVINNFVPPGGANLTQPQAFVQGLYHVYLSHTASLGELNAWVNALPTVGNAGVSYAIAHSQEGLTRLVDSLYQQLFGRTADSGGEAAFVQFLQSGGTEEQAMEALLSSPEFAGRASALAGTPGASADQNFVRALYKVLLGRAGETAAEDQSWLNVLAASDRAAVAAGFLRSAEFRGNYVAALYTFYPTLPANNFFGGVPDLLCRPDPPSIPEMNGWANSNLNMQQLAVFISASAEFFNNR